MQCKRCDKYKSWWIWHHNHFPFHHYSVKAKKYEINKFDEYAMKNLHESSAQLKEHVNQLTRMDNNSMSQLGSNFSNTISNAKK